MLRALFGGILLLLAHAVETRARTRALAARLAGNV